MTAPLQRFAADDRRVALPDRARCCSRWPRACGLPVAARRRRSRSRARCCSSCRLAAACRRPTSCGSRSTTTAGRFGTTSRVPGDGALGPRERDPSRHGPDPAGRGAGRAAVHARALAAAARVLTGRWRFAGRDARTVRAAARAPLPPPTATVTASPTTIDDCPAAANPAQGGCPVNNDGGGDGGRRRRRWRRQRRRPGDAASDGGHGRVRLRRFGAVRSSRSGATCTDSAQCASSFCVDGVCCGNACLGPCRSCNQPNADGICQPYAQGTDPASSAALAHLQRRGRVRPASAGRPQAEWPALRRRTASAESGFCKDGVCCNDACDGALPHLRDRNLRRRQPQDRPARVRGDDDLQRQRQMCRDVVAARS